MNQNAVETRANLLEAFLRIYETKPLAQITVKQICQLAGYNRSTFYNHFNDVPSMLELVEDETLNEIQGIVSKLTARELFQTDAIFVAIKAIYKDHHKELTVIMTKPDSHFPMKLKSLMERTITGFLPDLSEEDNEKLKMAIAYHFSAAIGMVVHWLSRQSSPDMNRAIDNIKEFSTEGVLTVIKKMI